MKIVSTANTLRHLSTPEPHSRLWLVVKLSKRSEVWVLFEPKNIQDIVLIPFQLYVTFYPVNVWAIVNVDEYYFSKLM